MAPTFRFAARRALLTYSQCDPLTKEDIVFTLEERFGKIQYSLGMEPHEDGGYHIHALIDFGEKLDRRGDASLFDIPDPTQEREDFHPNIEPVKYGKKHFDRAHEYVEKEDPDPLCTFPHKLTWDEIMDQAACGTEYLSLVKKNYPRDYALNLAKLEYVASKTFDIDLNTIPEDWRPTWTFTAPPSLNSIPPLAWSTKSLILVGTPGIGKTTWAKENIPKPALFVRHLDSLKSLKSSHRGIIFDDLDFSHLPVSTQKFIVDRENLAEIHIRYAVARIPSHVVRIFTCNEYPFTQEGVHAQAIERRVHTVYL